MAQAGNAVRLPGAFHPLSQRVGGASSYRGRIFNDGDCPSSKPFGQYHCDTETQCNEKLNLSNHSELIKYVQAVGKMEE